MAALTNLTRAGEPSSYPAIKPSLLGEPPAIAIPTAPTDPSTKGLPMNLDVVVKGNNAFAIALYQQLRDRKGNLFFSPYSTSTALAMTYAGARGQTATEMSKVLHFTLESESLHPAFASLITELNTKNQQGFQLSVVNRLWGQQGYGFLDSFVQLTQHHYGAALEEVDFISSTEQARRTINKWVEQQTQEKIQELIAPGILDSLTRLVLTNAIYFKGTWSRQFDLAHTKNQPFTVALGQQVDVPMMSQDGALGYAEWNDLQVLEMPYVGGKVSMVILLPKNVDGLAELEQQLTPENLETWLSSIRYGEKVDIWLPKFKVTSEFELNQVLSDMGMAIAFGGLADFSGMTGTKGIFISNVIHQAFVDVDEAGTEAAAATAVAMSRSMSSSLLMFHANRPFLFLIRDIESGSILFLGRIVNPLA
ncbi:MAG: serpin family protein [Coleofasciculus sp. S288]|nr:serpin family protein [Coleofasciculus sp. S288]